MFATMTPLLSVLSFFEAPRVPLALLCASPGIRRACEENTVVEVGSWMLHLSNDDGSRRVTWRPSAEAEYTSATGVACPVAWWCNRPVHAGCRASLTRLEIIFASRFLDDRLSVVFAFHSLVELTLRHAPIKDVSVLGKLPMLRKLDLVQAHVVDGGIIGLRESRSLQEVNLWGCKGVTNVNPLGDVPTLRCLVLTETCVSDGGITSLVEAQYISEVNLEACALVTNVGFFGRLPALQRLLLVTTSVDSKGIMGLSGSVSLREIDLWGCDGVDDVNSLGKIPTLRKLDLFRTSVTNEGITGLGKSSSLEEIDLTCCEAVSDVGALAKIPTLQHLVLLHTSVHDVAELLSMGVNVVI